ncbi:phage portal protein [Myroides odoratimimus]|uniref:phage portal protein n=1 Tax=Myroides odoratimimus TaxID=76832 RepID=UPI0025776492|nr:phage portal protein [Myroides odoratimimus]MDM1325906.1 phage portal protein [Myroides odoratimimus]MDM1452189.1 phage portal protein [Myroides odoratimimus]MDM1475472.1 phage portal protein [Myroides odoratimimus]MDM1488241.1 phage portal protein [Myroides odoratimimus]
MSILGKVFQPLESSGSSGFMDFFGGFRSGSKTVVTANKALTIAAFFNGLEQLSNDIAKLPKAVYIKSGDHRRKYSEHPLNYLISVQPNPMMSAYDFWKLVVIYVILKGNCYVLVNRDRNGVEKSLVIQHDEDVKVLEDKENNQLFYEIKGKVYAGSDILHFKGFSLDGKKGISVIKFAAYDLGVNLDAKEYQSDIYADRGLGYGVIEAEKPIHVDNKKIISDGFTAKMTEKNKFKVPVLDEGLKYKPISITPAEAQFLETNKEAVINICRWLNIAPHKVKDLNNGTYSNIEVQNIEHVQDSVITWTSRIENELDRKMFVYSVGGEEIAYVKFNEKVLLRGDSRARAEYLTKMIYSGVITRNEARALEDLDPLNGLDQPLTPVNMEMMEFMLAKNKKELEDE